MERNSSRASEGKVDLIKQRFSKWKEWNRDGGADLGDARGEDFGDKESESK